MSRLVKCKDCGEVLNKEDIHADFSECPYCKSTNIMYQLGFADRVEVNEQIKGKVKQQGIKKPRKEFIYGDDYYKTEGKWVDKKRIIDRENDSYEEVVKDKDTGEIIHECKESLKAHFGHGSAKFKKDNK